MTADDTGEGSSTPFQRKPGGVFITRGMAVRIPAGGLQISDNPDIESRMELHMFFDVCPTWLDIAFRRVLEASTGRKELMMAWATPDNQRVRVALEHEFEASMQAMAAAAFALDAFHANVKERIEIPLETKAAWREKKTARHAQISEVLRLAFKMGPKSFEMVSAAIKEVMHFRDLAVHPPGQHDAPVEHPVLKVGVEWRFVAFSLKNAQKATSLSLGFIAQLLRMPKQKFAALVDYCDGCKARVDPIAAAWEQKVGPLWHRPDSEAK